MKLAYVVSMYPAQSHTFIHREIEALRALGFEIDTYSIRKAGAGNILGEASQEEARRTRWLVPPDVVALVTALIWGLATRPALMLRLFFESVFAPRTGLRDRALWACYYGEAVLLAYWMVQRKTDHVHCHFGNSGSNTAYIASRLSGIPMSITFHGIDLDEPVRHRHAVKLAHAKFAVCISKFGRSRLMFSTPPEHWEKISIVHCGLTPPEDTTQPPELANHLLCVARLSIEKGHLVLFRALLMLKAKGLPFRCTLVGDGPMRGELESAVMAMGLSDCVTFAGAQPPTKVAEHFREANVGLLASFGEGIPVVLMEAFAHARPVISTYVGGIPELVRDGENGYLVPPGSAGDLAAAIERIVRDPANAAAMGQRGRGRVLEAFREDTGAARLAALFRGERP